MANPAAVFQDVAWLPPGGQVEIHLDAAPLTPDLCTSAFVFVLNGAGEILMTQVLARGLDIPGGHIEAGEAPAEAAVREAREETGARVLLGAKLGHLTTVVPAPPPGYKYPTPRAHQVFYVAELLALGPVLMPQECGPPVWVPLDALRDDPRFRLHRPFFDALQAQAPAVAPPFLIFP